MEYTSYQEGSFSSTIKSLQSQISNLNSVNLKLTHQLQAISNEMLSVKAENITLKQNVQALREELNRESTLLREVQGDTALKKPTSTQRKVLKD